MARPLRRSVHSGLASLRAKRNTFAMTAPARLSDTVFASIVRHTPLVALDLVVTRDQRFLLGERCNRPAQGSWFVPGGRIRKEERLTDALGRLSREELGLTLPWSRVEQWPVEEHLYPDSMLDPTCSTHYLVIPLRIQLLAHEAVHPDAQHTRFHWLTAEEGLAEPRVHENTRRYLLRDLGRPLPLSGA